MFLAICYFWILITGLEWHESRVCLFRIYRALSYQFPGMAMDFKEGFNILSEG